MDSIVALPGRIVEWLSEKEQLSDINFFTDFPPINKAVPLKRAIVAIGIEELKITDKFIENDDGVLERQEYCRTANILMRTSICVPYSYGGDACHDIFTKIIDQLTFNSSLNITESSCEETQSDRDTSALVLKGTFKITADFCPAEEVDNNYFSFSDKEFFCGNHIRNNEIHVTSAEKDKWNEPFSMGAFFGTGATSRSINLGFRPKFLMVFASEYPTVFVDFSLQKSMPYFAVAFDGYASQGIAINENGFRVFRTNYENSAANFNESGTGYCYIAMK